MDDHAGSTWRSLVLLLCFPAVLPAQPSARPPGQTPPMGWNSWNNFGCRIDEQLILDTADAMVESGMKDAGYVYVNVDDCWMASERDAAGNLQSDPERFPHGIAYIADYVHAKGLKLGIYSSAGTRTCQGLPASLDHEEADARKFAEWGVDYLKYDNCNNEGRPAIERYTKMRDALRATGRPIFFSICEWGANRPWEWAPALGNSWRTTGDIYDSWQSMTDILDQQVGLARFASRGHWNDPDMLEVGNGGMTDTEYRAHFSLWSLLSAPLLAGNDLRAMSKETKAILTNPEVISVNQDPVGMQGYRLRDDGDQEVWVKELADGSVAVVLLNRGGRRAFMTAFAREIGLPDARAYRERDLWAHEARTRTDGLVRAYVPPHGARMFR
ncbi:MAG: alpha-galactosidase, partial [Gemmatimonadales bacterium]